MIWGGEPPSAVTAARREVAYRRFWAGVGDHFPDLGGAASTRYYADNERRLFRDYFHPLDGLKIFKTDLWDEARNTRILAWARGQGACTYGIDISEPTVFQARQASRSVFRCCPAERYRIRRLPR